MNITDIKTQIKNKQISQYYIFTGDELEVQRIYINKIAEIHGGSIVRPASIAEAWPSIISPSLFDEPSVYVVRDDKDLMQNDVLQRQVEQSNLNGNIIIHLVTSVDKRTKWYKSNSDKIVSFERLSTEILVKHCQQLVALNKSNCERLIAICENDYSRILLEIDKIKSFISASPESDCNAVFGQFVADGTIYQPPKDAIFELVDAILKRQVNKVYNLLEQCYAVGEANMVILSVLFNNARQVLQVQSCTSADIAKSTGLTAWQVKCAKDKCGYYTNGELVYMLRTIQKVQKGIITGQIEDSLAVEYLLVNIL